MAQRIFYVACGGALGSVARYLVSVGCTALLGAGFPWGTLAVNVVGSGLMGAITYVALHTGTLSLNLRLFLTTGILGGFTTYSAFNQETLLLVQDGRTSAALANVAANLAGAMAAALVGLAIARWTI